MPKTLLAPSRVWTCDACSAAGASTSAACCSRPRGRASSASAPGRAAAGYTRLLTGSCWDARTSWSALLAETSRGSRRNPPRPGPPTAHHERRVASGSGHVGPSRPYIFVTDDSTMGRTSFLVTTSALGSTRRKITFSKGAMIQAVALPQLKYDQNASLYRLSRSDKILA